MKLKWREPITCVEFGDNEYTHKRVMRIWLNGRIAGHLLVNEQEKKLVMDMITESQERRAVAS